MNTSSNAHRADPASIEMRDKAGCEPEPGTAVLLVDRASPNLTREACPNAALCGA